MNYIFGVSGRVGVTTRHASSNSVQSLLTVKPPEDGKFPVAAVITNETKDIRIAWGASPTQGPTPFGHLLYAGQSLKLSSPSSISGFNFISSVSNNHGTMHVTYEYES